MRAGRLVLLALLALCTALPGRAWAQARAGDEAGASPLAPALARFDDLLAGRIAGADDAGGRWLLGRLASLDPVAQARDFAAAHAREPRELLFAASFADACMRPVAPGFVECGERDIVGYWASRDPDNAVPWLLQAERARRRNNTAALIDNLERASRAARFDDYSGRGGAVFAARLVPLVAAEDRAAAWIAADRQGSVPMGAPLEALEAVCSPVSRSLAERIPTTCVRLGGLMAERATAFHYRRAGTQVAQAASTTESGRNAVRDAARQVVVDQERCRVAYGALERLAAGTPAERQRAASIAERLVAERAKAGEPAACEGLARAMPQR
jgi:hypothetical protein